MYERDEGSTAPMKAVERWYSDRMYREISLARWGTFGTPVLVFPTAGGDAEEIERMHLVAACGDLIDAGRVKLYSCDSLAGRAMLTEEGSPEFRAALLNAFHESVRREIIPAIFADCGGELPVIVAGASIGAFNSIAVTCRYPEVFAGAIAMSGTYDLDKHYPAWSENLYFSSPLQFVPGMGGPTLDLLRHRMIILASGSGDWEDVGESWRMAAVLGSQGVPNRVDDWGPQWPHDWHTWRAMLPKYLGEIL
jgi:esterase/lipase superfamily enzyme